MNTEQVVEMIDAISEGQPFDIKLNNDVTLSVARWVTLYVDGIGPIAKTNDPRTAREIAAALIAWAERKDGLITQRTIGSILGDIRRTELLNKEGNS